MARSSDSERVSVLDVLRFVWSYWRQLPVRLALIIVGVLVAVLLEIQIPERSARRQW